MPTIRVASAADSGHRPRGCAEFALRRTQFLHRQRMIDEREPRQPGDERVLMVPEAHVVASRKTNCLQKSSAQSRQPRPPARVPARAPTSLASGPMGRTSAFMAVVLARGSACKRRLLVAAVARGRGRATIFPLVACAVATPAGPSGPMPSTGSPASFEPVQAGQRVTVKPRFRHLAVTFGGHGGAVV